MQIYKMLYDQRIFPCAPSFASHIMIHLTRWALFGLLNHTVRFSHANNIARAIERPPKNNIKKNEPRAHLPAHIICKMCEAVLTNELERGRPLTPKRPAPWSKRPRSPPTTRSFLPSACMRLDRPVMWDGVFLFPRASLALPIDMQTFMASLRCCN